MFIMKEAFEQQFCIWGTGKFSKNLSKRIGEYIPIYKRIFSSSPFDYLEYYIDSNVEMQKQTFYGKQIKSPQYFLNDKPRLCVVAVLNKEEICKILEEHGFKKNRHYISNDNFINMLRRSILNKREEIFKQYDIPFLASAEEIDFNELILLVKRAFLHVEQLENHEATILKYVIFSLLAEKWVNSSKRKEDFWLLRENFDSVLIVAAFAWYYGNNIAEWADWFSQNVTVQPRKKQGKQTIGVVVNRYFGGGIEKVVSLLIQIYLKNNHKVVLITDIIDSDKEYDLPSEVIRCVITPETEGSKEKRLEELSMCAVKNQIDIMCFHSGYTSISTFYDMLSLKLQNIAVLMEIHSAFLPIIMAEKEISRNYSYMYKSANKLVVLSNMDKVFWENLGCDCEYIQNPIEDSYKEIGYREKTERHQLSNTIVWIGRLVQVPKNVFDTIAIMKIVIEKIPDAKLKIAGLADSQLVYNSLIQSIKENHLENNIELCGYKSDISQIYKEADVVLMTSSSESFCNVIMESKLYGVPLVMYELPWLELLKGGEGYIAVRQRDTLAAAEAVVNVLSNQSLREKMSKESFDSIEPFLRHDVYSDWKRVFDEMNQINRRERREAKNESDCNVFTAISQNFGE